MDGLNKSKYVPREDLLSKSTGQDDDEIIDGKEPLKSKTTAKVEDQDFQKNCLFSLHKKTSGKNSKEIITEWTDSIKLTYKMLNQVHDELNSLSKEIKDIVASLKKLDSKWKQEVEKLANIEKFVGQAVGKSSDAINTYSVEVLKPLKKATAIIDSFDKKIFDSMQPDDSKKLKISFEKVKDIKLKFEDAQRVKNLKFVKNKEELIKNLPNKKDVKHKEKDIDKKLIEESDGVIQDSEDSE